MAHYRTISNVTLTADKIKVMWGGTEYICDKQTYSNEDWRYYGAPYNDDTGEFDFSDIPFGFSYEDGEDYIGVSSETNEAVDVQITEVIETEAVWKKLGEGSSPTPPTPTPIEGDLENGLTVQPSAWVNSGVDAPFYNIQAGQIYDLYLNDEKIGSNTAQNNELAGGAYVEYNIGTELNPNALEFTNVPDVDTTRVYCSSPPNTAVTIQLVLNDAS